MKKKKKIIYPFILLIFIGIFIHPERVIYIPKIEGKILDPKGNPIENATVSRIEEKSWKNEEFGYYEYEKFKSQTVKTDKNGKFELAEKSRIEWIHNTPFHLLVVLCYAEFEVSKTGYETYKTEYGEFEKENKNYNACKGIEFKAEIILKKL
tara:strand:- start:43 stop:498 length:456 start_codon:yes stop_codon:yes gene_type:complete